MNQATSSNNMMFRKGSEEFKKLY